MTIRNTRSPLLLASSLALLLALGACGKNDDRTAGQKLDSAIASTDAAAEKAKDDARIAAAKTEDAMKNAADATKTAGSNAAQDVKAAGAALGEKLDDAGITAKVSSGLATDKDLSAIKINVDTKDGVVTLNGPAPSADAKARATEIARNVKGVTSVDNKLVVKAS